MNEIIYQVETDITAEEYRDILVRSTLGSRRPVDDLDRIEKMCKNANLIITARQNNKLIGVARSLTDFAFNTYLADLAVDEEYQKKGIGKRLIFETKKEAPNATVILLAAPEAIGYYPKIGMTQYEYSYMLRNIEDLK